MKLCLETIIRAERNAFSELVNRWTRKYPSLKVHLQPRSRLYFNHLSYRVGMRRMIYTMSWIERLNRNHKRTLRMRSAMSSPDAVLFLPESFAIRRKEFEVPLHQLVFEKGFLLELKGKMYINFLSEAPMVFIGLPSKECCLEF